ncbi:LysM peptidoglycan-binding domain-containing protein [Leuconostoc lactis]|uniref:LysM peptidoglycan-binding domain-containing protein n=1 Tax=Leuconostoc lactis TaxID=1246 RepID=UPI0024AE22C6|nr:LysM peptidoglycan-binding domain-containing protein [Leuconostoc lactis]MDI6573862.1 LysM peptidoglycan-binding domain-containing protein [Leuconostoc lactis]
MKTSTMLKSAVAAGAFAVAGVATANADTITVQAGDTLSKLARANGTTVDALVKANGISNPNLIFVGQQLQTEGTANAAAPAQPAATQPAASAPAASANGTYTVKAGDTLNRIAAANGTSVAALAAANGIQNINLIAVGQVLKLSADATAPAATPAPAQQAAPAQPAASGSVPDDVKYIAAADTNRDGFMTAAEYLAYQANGGTTAPAAPAAPAPAAPAPAAPQVTQVSTAGNSAAATMLNSLNALRASLGLRPVTLDAGLSAQAQSRAYNAVANGGLPTNHFRTNGEVVAIGFGFNQVISAWYNETGMMTNGTPGHRMWVTNPRATSVGFGVVGGTIVAVSNVGQY